MEYFNKILCVTYAELTGGSDAVIKAATLRQNMSRGNIVSVHRGGGEGGQALYAWQFHSSEIQGSVYGTIR